MRGKVIEVDFSARCRVKKALSRPSPGRPAAKVVPGPALPARRALIATRDFLLFWRPPARRTAAEYLGGRWDWGWTLFVWTSDSAVGPVWTNLVSGRGYVPQWLPRDAFLSFLHRASDIGGLLLNGELEDSGEVIRAEPDQLIRREEALSELGG